MYSFLKYVLCVCRHLSVKVNPRYKGIDGRFHQKHRQARQSFACIFPPDKPTTTHSVAGHCWAEKTVASTLLEGAVAWDGSLEARAAECVLAFFLPSSVHSLWQQGHSILLQHGRQSLSPLQKNRVQTPPSLQYSSHLPLSSPPTFIWSIGLIYLFYLNHTWTTKFKPRDGYFS